MFEGGTKMSKVIQVPKTDDEIKEYHRKKRYELSLKSLGEIPQLEEPTDEQKEWVLRRLKGPAWTWKRWYE
jgi:hypothetical protein